MSTRKASGEVLTELAPVLPELWGGSADLAESNNTTMEGEPSFVPAEHQTKMWPGGPYGRTLHFGIREHAMGAIMNGINAARRHPGLRRHVPRVQRLHAPAGAAGRADGAARRSSSGPTTRSGSAATARPTSRSSTWPSLRAIPGLDVVRPADANETAACWRRILEKTDGPAGIACRGRTCRCSTRRAPPTPARARYILEEASSGGAKVIIIATGSEVALALDAREALEAEGTPTRVVSMPCIEWFEAQPASYRQEVLPPEIKARVSVEAAVEAGLARVRRRGRRDHVHRALRRQRRR